MNWSLQSNMHEQHSVCVRRKLCRNAVGTSACDLCGQRRDVHVLRLHCSNCLLFKGREYVVEG